MDALFEPRYNGIIFDLDGTLIDSLEDLTDACNEVMLHYNLPPKNYEEAKKLIGRGLRVLIQRALPKEMAEDDALVDEATALMKSYYAKRYTNKTKPYDGIMALIRYLHVHNIPFGVCTNKPDNAAKIIIDTLFDSNDFVDVVGQNEGKPRKPDPTQTLELAEKMGVSPEKCIYMGDSVVDYETAKNAGMLPVLCTWGFTEPEKLMTYDDAIWIRSPHRVIDALKYGDAMYDVFNEKKEDELK